MNTTVERCQSCGGNLSYDIAKKALVCQACGAKETIKKDYIINKASKRPVKDSSENVTLEAAEILKCNACGAEIILNGFEVTAECEYCGSHSTMTYKDSKLLKPSGILPFTITEEIAVQRFRKWVSSRRLAPTRLKKELKIDGINGFYSPFMSFDYNVITKYDGLKFYSPAIYGRDPKVAGWQKVENEKASEIKITDDLVSVASSRHRMTLKYINKYDFNKLVAYNPSYLSGFHSERGSITIEQSYEESKIGSKRERDIELVNIKNKFSEISNAKNFTYEYKNPMYLYVLLPIWMLTYHYKGNVYDFAVNGQTGDFIGTTPVSRFKIGLIILLIGLVILIYVYVFEILEVI